MRRDLIIIGEERKKQGGDLRKEYIRIYSHVLACKSSLIRVSIMESCFISICKRFIFSYNLNDLNFSFLCFEIL